MPPGSLPYSMGPFGHILCARPMNTHTTPPAEIISFYETGSVPPLAWFRQTIRNTRNPALLAAAGLALCSVLEDDLSRHRCALLGCQAHPASFLPAPPDRPPIHERAGRR